jgi:glycosyltransferase involved in cell wall biosynthesis
VPLKILLTVDPEIPVPPPLYGGIERILDALVNEFVAKGHDVTLCAHPSSTVPCKLVPWKGLRSQDKMDTLKNMYTLTRLVQKGKFDIVHSFSRLAYMTMIFPFRIPKMMSYQREPSLTQIKKAEKLARKGSFVVTGCSDYISNQIATVAEAYTVYNCAPVERYTFIEAVEEDAPLMFLGRIEDIKGTHTAIEVAKRTGRKLIIAGNIPQGKESYFEEEVKPHLNERITYVGPVNDEQKNELLGKCLAFLMPIQWNEPFGIVMAEAMACGTPVLGFPMGSVPEVVENKISGFVCSDIDDMVNRVNDCKQIDRKKVREVAETRFSNRVIAENYLDLYKKIIERNKSKK